MNIKVIVCDVDGTLLNSSYKIPSKTQDFLLELQKRGIVLVLASGRSYTRLTALSEQLDMDKYDGYLIDSNGTSIYNVRSKERSRFGLLKNHSIKRLNKYFSTFNVETQYVQDESLYIYLTDTIRNLKVKIRSEMKLPDNYPWPGGEYGWFCDLRDAYPNQILLEKYEDHPNSCNKITVTQDPNYLQFVYDSLKRSGLNADFEIVFSNERMLEITEKGLNKGNTLLKLMRELKVNKEEIIVFGDSENDLSMFDHVIHSVAMGNSLSSVKQKAKHVTADHDNEGIYDMLKTFYKKGYFD